MSTGASNYLIRTNVVLAMSRGNPVGLAVEATYGLLAAPGRMIISVVTRGDLLSLARQFGWGEARVAELKRLISRAIEIGIDDAVVDAYAEIDAASHQAGRRMGKNDLWIAATARAFGLTLLTTDRDFDHLHGPWIDRIWIDPDASKPT